MDKRAALFEAGEGTVDITPPLGIELGGFHIPIGSDRKITSIRQPGYARALVVGLGDAQAAIISLDTLGFSDNWAAAVRKDVFHGTGIPAENVFVCATHSHSMPPLSFIRRCGEVSEEYSLDVRQKAVGAAIEAQHDMAPAKMLIGRACVAKGRYEAAKAFHTVCRPTRKSRCCYRRRRPLANIHRCT